MDPEQFRIQGKRMIDLVADYWQNVPQMKPVPDVKPGFMRKMLPEEAPEKGEDWNKIFQDIEPCVLKTTTNWHHPHFFGYYPTAIGYPSILGDILSDGIGCVGFTWLASPACTELELIVLDWLAKMIELPEHFLNSHPGPGAGMIQSTASECTLVALLAARGKALKNVTDEKEKYAKMGRLVAYTSDQAHSSVERAALFAAIKIRLLPTDENFALQADTFEKAVKEDIENGYEPIFLCASLGTTSSCAFDNLPELGSICKKYDLWLHVDAAYAGATFICPEYRHYMKGIEFADSFNFNAHKLLATSFDCACFWMRDGSEVKQAFLVDPLYLRHAHENDSMDLRHYQLPLGRRFRALKLWFTLRAFGIDGLQEWVRKPCRLAKEFENLVKLDNRFEIGAPVALGLVCFRMKGPNSITETLLKRLHDDRRIYLVPTILREKIVLRLAINPASTTSEDIKFVWDVIREMADSVLSK
jgi:aromatic-L-amino-acid decarboxylase